MRKIVRSPLRLVDVFLQVTSENRKWDMVVSNEDDELTHPETQDQFVREDHMMLATY